MNTSRRGLLLTAALFAIGIIGFGCNSQVKVSDLNIQDLDYASLAGLAANPKIIKKMGPVVFVDVRNAQAYSQGHIPGAINITVPRIVGLDPRLAKARTIVLYGEGWKDYLVPVAWKKMTALGYEGLYTFRGGVKEWTKQGRALEPGPRVDGESQGGEDG